MPSVFLGHFFRRAFCRLFSWIIFEQRDNVIETHEYKGDFKSGELPRETKAVVR